MEWHNHLNRLVFIWSSAMVLLLLESIANSGWWVAQTFGRTAMEFRGFAQKEMQS